MSEDAGDTGGVRSEPEAETQTSPPDASASSADQIGSIAAAEEDLGPAVPVVPDPAAAQHLHQDDVDVEEGAANAGQGQGDDQPNHGVHEGSQTESSVGANPWNGSSFLPSMMQTRLNVTNLTKISST